MRDDPAPPPGPPPTSVLRRLTGFTVLPLLSLVTPFLLMPVIARIAGGAGWSSVVAGQAVGTIGAAVLLWGWNVVGPVQVARAPDAAARAQVYAASLRTRLALLLVVAPGVALVSLAVAAPGFRETAAAMGMATALLGLTPSWFAIGLGQPMLLLWYDTVPRFLAAVAATPLVLLSRQIWPYPLLLGLSVVGSLGAFHRRVAAGTGLPWSPWPLTRSVRDLRGQLGTAGINLSATAYASTPVPIVTRAVPQEASSRFASADAIYRLGLFTVAAMGNAFQGWTLEPGADSRRRHGVAAAAHLGLGAVGGLGLAALGPWATALLFGDAVAATREVCALYGLSFFFISASSPLIRNVLVPAGRDRLVLVWTALSAALGLAVMAAAALAGSAAGVALGMAVSEAVLCVVLLRPAVRLVPPRAEAV